MSKPLASCSSRKMSDYTDFGTVTSAAFSCTSSTPTATSPVTETGEDNTLTVTSQHADKATKPKESPGALAQQLKEAQRELTALKDNLNQLVIQEDEHLQSVVWKRRTYPALIERYTAQQKSGALEKDDCDKEVKKESSTSDGGDFEKQLESLPAQIGHIEKENLKKAQNVQEIMKKLEKAESMRNAERARIRRIQEMDV